MALVSKAVSSKAVSSKEVTSTPTQSKEVNQVNSKSVVQSKDVVQSKAVTPASKSVESKSVTPASKDVVGTPQSKSVQSKSVVRAPDGKFCKRVAPATPNQEKLVSAARPVQAESPERSVLREMFGTLKRFFGGN